MKSSLFLSARILPGLLLLAGAVTARADVVFLDMNFSPLETAAAEKSAAARGEKLIVIPRIPPTEQEKILKLKARVSQLWSSYTRIAANIRSPEEAAKNPKINETWQEYRRAAADLSSFNERYSMGKNGVAMLRKTLASLPANSVTALVVSSHHAGSSFFGTLGSVDEKELQDFLASESRVRTSLRSLWLWGCYTATLDKVREWKDRLPGLRMIAGYDDSAPSGEKAVSARTLETLMNQEARLVAKSESTGSSPQALEALRSARSQLPLGGGSTSAAICVDCNYVSRDAGLNLYQKIECPPATLRKDREGQSLLKDYLEARAGHEDVPADTGRSELRSYYSFLNKNLHCEQLKGRKADAETLVKLVHFRNILKNFHLFSGPRLDQLRSRARELGLELSLPDFGSGSVTRAQVLAAQKNLQALVEKETLGKNGSRGGWMQAVDGVISRFSPSKAVRNRGEFLKLAREVNAEMRGLLVTLRCVPLDWVEPASSAAVLSRPEPSCFR